MCWQNGIWRGTPRLQFLKSARSTGPSRRRCRLLILAGDPALARFLHEYPGADSQKLRTLIRNARREQSAALPPKSYRELFRVLREMTTKEPAADT